MNESELPDDLEFVERQPVTAGSGAAPTQNFDRYQGAILSAPLGLDTDIAKSQLPGVNPAYRFMPASLAGNPATNASVQSTARKVIAATPAPPSSSGGSVSLDVPNIFTPIAQTVTLPGPLSFSLATEAVGTFLGVNGLANAPFPDDVVVGGGGTSATVSLTTPGHDLVFYFAAVDNLHGSGLTGPGAGWTAIPGGGYGSTSGGAYQTDSAGTLVTQTQSYTTGNPSFQAMSVALLSIPYITTPVITSRGTGSGSFQSTGVVGTPAAGEALLAYALINNVSAGGGNASDVKSVTDSQNNIWFKVGGTTNSGNVLGTNFGTGVSLWFCPSPRTGVSTTVTFSAGTNPISAAVGVVGITGLSPNTGIPVFSPINLNSLAGILGVASGGTSADLSQTGAAHSYVAQLTAGGPFSVQQPDFNDLAGAAGALPGHYNGVTLVAAGLVSEVGNKDLTGQVASTSGILFTTPLSPVAGTQNKVSWNAKVTTVDGVSSTLGPLSIGYTDPDGVAQNITACVAQSKAGVIETSDSGNTTTTVLLGLPLMLNCKANTNITFNFTYTAGANQMIYNLHIRVEALG